MLRKSDITVRRRIALIANDMKEQVVTEVKESHYLSYTHFSSWASAGGGKTDIRPPPGNLN